MQDLLEKVYESPSSIVFKKIEQDGIPLAIKVLKASHAHPRSILQFNNEYAILSDLDIPGVKKSFFKRNYPGLARNCVQLFRGANAHRIHSIP